MDSPRSYRSRRFTDQQPASGSPNDPDVQAFLDTTGIMDPTIIAALNFRVRSKKGQDLSFNPSGLVTWDKIKTDHPFVGASSAKDKYSLKNLSTTDITYSGGVAHNANGITGNGFNASASFAVTATDLGQDTVGVGIYSRTSAQSSSPALGMFDVSSSIVDLYPRWVADNVIVAANDAESGGTSNTDASGHFIFTRQSSSVVNLWIRGVKHALSISSAAPGTRNMRLLAIDGAGSVSQFSSYNLAACTTYFQSLTDAEAAVEYAIEQQFQTMLSRNV